MSTSGPKLKMFADAIWNTRDVVRLGILLNSDGNKRVVIQIFLPWQSGAADRGVLQVSNMEVGICPILSSTLILDIYIYTLILDIR